MHEEVIYLLGGLLGKKNSVDVGQNSSRGNGYSSKKLVQLLIVLNGKSDVPGNNTGLLVVTSSVSGKLEDLSAEVLENSGEVNRGSSSDTRTVLSLTKESSDTSHRVKIEENSKEIKYKWYSIDDKD